jgi:hypothetical protein
MTGTEIIVLIAIALVAFAVAKALFNGLVVVAVVALIAIALGGYSITQMRSDAGSVLHRGVQLACPKDASAQLFVTRRRQAQIERALRLHTVGPQRRDDLSVEAATLRAKTLRLTPCIKS